VAEFERGNDKAALCQSLVEALGPRQIAARPRTTVQIDDSREWPGSLGLVQAGNQPSVAVPQIFDIFGRNFVIWHDHSRFGVARGCGSRRPAAARPSPSLLAIGGEENADTTNRRTGGGNQRMLPVWPSE
jgi:hypothetical protein